MGDDAVGKTTLLYAWTNNKCVPDAEHFGSYAPEIKTPDGQICSLSIIDTAGTEEYNRLRPLAYPDTGVVLVCFSTVVPESLENVSKKWVPEIQQHCPGTPFLLVGTQIDLKEDRATIDKLADKNQKPISSEEGLDAAKQVGAEKYAECSSLTMEGVKDLFDQAILQALKKQGEKSEKKMKNCAIS